jgi:hypothetical protein
MRRIAPRIRAAVRAFLAILAAQPTAGLPGAEELAPLGRLV